MNCWIKNCKICKKENLWEYLFRMPFKESMKHIRWSEMVWLIICYSILMYFLGWFIGFIVAWIFTWSFADLDGGAIADIYNEYPNPEYTPQKCSENIKGCKICNNPYSHNFNLLYEKNKRWYDYII